VFIFTRPFGATFGDFLTKPIEKGGLGLGTIPSTLITIILLIILITYSGITENRTKKLIAN
jgi:uncharacterized membrane-anchored protein